MGASKNSNDVPGVTYTKPLEVSVIPTALGGMKRSKNYEYKKRSRHKPISENGFSHEENPVDEKQLHKAKTPLGRRYLNSLKPKLYEPAKNCLFLRGTRCSSQVKELLSDLVKLRKPYSLFLTRKQENFNLLADNEPVIYLCQKNNCSLFCYGSTTKQHPFRLILGRTYDNHVLDMYECDIENYVALKEFRKKLQPAYGTKPLVLAIGTEFETLDVLKNFRNFLIDFFAVVAPDKLYANGIDQVIALIATPGTSSSSIRVLVRRYKLICTLQASLDSKTLLDEVGPSFTMMLTFSQGPERDMWKNATKQPKIAKPSKRKNISTNVLGQTLGRVHVGVQDLKDLNTRHYHGKAKKTSIAD